MPAGFNRDYLAVGLVIALNLYMLFRLLHDIEISNKAMGLRHAELGFTPNCSLTPHNLYRTHCGVLIVVYVLLIPLL